MSEDISVDLGEIPLDHAKTLLLAVQYALAVGSVWQRDDYERYVALKAMLTYRIALAEKTAAA